MLSQTIKVGISPPLTWCHLPKNRSSLKPELSNQDTKGSVIWSYDYLTIALQSTEGSPKAPFPSGGRPQFPLKELRSTLSNGMALDIKRIRRPKRLWDHRPHTSAVQCYTEGGTATYACQGKKMKQLKKIITKPVLSKPYKNAHQWHIRPCEEIGPFLWA